MVQFFLSDYIIQFIYLIQDARNHTSHPKLALSSLGDLMMT
jgi:hypothetical protein